MPVSTQGHLATRPNSQTRLDWQAITACRRLLPTLYCKEDSMLELQKHTDILCRTLCSVAVSRVPSAAVIETPNLRIIRLPGQTWSAELFKNTQQELKTLHWRDQPHGTVLCRFTSRIKGQSFSLMNLIKQKQSLVCEFRSVIWCTEKHRIIVNLKHGEIHVPDLEQQLDWELFDASFSCYYTEES